MVQNDSWFKTTHGSERLMVQNDSWFKVDSIFSNFSIKISRNGGNVKKARRYLDSENNVLAHMQNSCIRSLMVTEIGMKCKIGERA